MTRLRNQRSLHVSALDRYGAKVVANIDLGDGTLSNIHHALAHRLRSRNIDLVSDIDLALAHRSHLRRPTSNLVYETDRTYRHRC